MVPGGATVVRRRLGSELPSLGAAAACLVAVLSGWRGADWPAQLFRIDLFERSGFSLWNNRWYGGHHLLGYSALFPALGALVGPTAVGVLSVVCATACFDRLTRPRFGAGARLGSAWFGVAAVANLAVGRLTFLLGLALGMAALLAAQRGRHAPAAVATVACALASPVSGAFLALAWVAWAAASRRLGPLVLAIAALLPVGVVALAFPTGGRFPFGWTTALVALTASVVAWRLLGRHEHVLRIGAALYAAAVVCTWLVPNPMGANVARLWVTVLGPLLLCAGVVRRGLTAVVLVPVLAAAQLLPAADAVLRAPRDPSRDLAYHQPLIDELVARGATTSRVEIPFTRRHWEARYVAAVVPIARGWERQLDILTNPLFYEPELPMATYMRWLDDNGVQFVALPDVELDASAEAEARLLEEGVPGLHLVWEDEHWRLWERRSGHDLVVGPATVVAIGDDFLELAVHGTGAVVVRVRASTHWRAIGPACVEPTADGWIRLTGLQPGRVVLEQVLARTHRSDEPDLCANGT